MSTRIRIVVFAAVFVLSSCSRDIALKSTPDEKPFSKIPELPRGIYIDPNAAIRNKSVMDGLSAEFAIHGPPKICVALSGGGMRAAAFSMGVLHALYKEGLLDRVDLFSGVSGGSYAVSWLYAQQFLNRGTDSKIIFDSLFDTNPLSKRKDSPDMTIAHGAPVPTIAGERWIAANGDLAPVWKALGEAAFDTVIGAPINAALNGLFGLHVNTSVSSETYYQDSLRRIFQGDRDIDMAAIAKFVQDNHLPPFVFNATASFDDDVNHYGGLLANTVFEFTPVRFGADSFGYRDIAAVDTSLSVVVAISGASVDLPSMVTGNFEKFSASALNDDLGRYEPNPNPRFARRPLADFLPGGWANPKWRRSPQGFDIYLTDGGYSENLGVFAAVRRLCDHILIVDAEHDPDYGFWDYFRLKYALRRELNVDLVVSGIDDRTTESQPLYPSTATKPFSLERRRCDFDFSRNVRRGKIEFFPIKKDEKDGLLYLKSIDVLFVKLAVDEEAGIDGDFGPYVQDQLHANQQKLKDGKLDQCRKTESLSDEAKNDYFPQIPTTNQDLTNGQMRALIDLGFFNLFYYLEDQRLHGQEWPNVSDATFSTLSKPVAGN